jgi:hypothetical protein
VVYLETVRSAAQVRLDLALAVLEDEGIEATGQVGDYDPFLATIDAVASRRPDEIVISTFPAGTSRWLRRHLVERVADATGLPVTHVVDDVKRDEACYDTSLVIANRTADSDELREHLADMPDPGGSHRFIVVVPQRDRDARGSRSRALASARGGASRRRHDRRPGRIHGHDERPAALPR